MTYEVPADYTTVLKSLYYYYYIFEILVILIVIFYRDNVDSKKVKGIKLNIDRNMIFFDLITLGLIGYFLSEFFSAGGFKLFSYDKQTFTGVLNIYEDKVLIYGDLWMIGYSFYVLACVIKNRINGKKQKLNSLRNYMILFYWGIYLLAGVRRGLMFFLLMVFIFALTNYKINKKKVLLFMGSIFSILLFLGYFREKVKYSDNSLIYIKIFGEFIYSQWITYFYIVNPKKLLDGVTYLYTVLYVFPKSILPNKPEDLGIMFWKEAGTNTALAFNPVAEGIINFGQWAAVFVPIIIFVIIFLIRKYRKNFLLYIIVSGAAINFCRGQMAITVFECLFIFIVIKIISLTTAAGRDETYE